MRCLIPSCLHTTARRLALSNWASPTAPHPHGGRGRSLPISKPNQTPVASTEKIAMTTERETTGVCREDVNAKVGDIAQALRSLEPNDRHRKNELFSKLYPVIVEMLGQNVTRKSILEVLAAKGLKLHPA